MWRSEKRSREWCFREKRRVEGSLEHLRVMYMREKKSREKGRGGDLMSKLYEN